MAQENLIKASGIPFTIVHATQFFEFVKNIAQSATDGSTIRLSPVLMQPMVSDDVAAAVADVALGEPMNAMVEVAGPDKIRQDELVRQYLSATGDPRNVVTDANAGYYGIKVNDQSLVPGDNPRLGTTHFAEWLSRTTTQKTATEKQSAPASNLSGKAAKVIALFLCGIVFAALSLGDAAANDSSTDKSKVAATAEPKEAKVTQLFSKDLTDLPGKEGLMLMIEYPPGSSDPIHRHNAHGFIYVLEGSIVMQVRGGKEITLTPGQTFYEGPEDVHVVGRNASKTKPAKFVVFFVKDKGAPVLVPTK
jgi:quercetin dioxygenase-like cupin family protein